MIVTEAWVSVHTSYRTEESDGKMKKLKKMRRDEINKQ